MASAAFGELGGRGYLLSVVAALLAGAVLRVWFILAFAHITGDTLIYGDIALNWVRHGVYGFSQTLHGLPAPPRPTLIRLPGYPIFLAACFAMFGAGRYGVVLFLQAGLGPGDMRACCHDNRTDLWQESGSGCTLAGCALSLQRHLCCVSSY